MNAKKILALALAALMLLSLAACGQKADETPNDALSPPRRKLLPSLPKPPWKPPKPPRRIPPSP